VSAERFAYTGDPALLERVTRALRRVVDPEMALDIVSLGLVNAIEISGRTARARITMTSPACPVTELIVDETRGELFASLDARYDVEVDVEWEPAWTPERMSESARRAMGWE
jgi:metal-sulfur cluster biosynthetic enzyme